MGIFLNPHSLFSSLRNLGYLSLHYLWLSYYYLILSYCLQTLLTFIDTQTFIETHIAGYPPHPEEESRWNFSRPSLEVWPQNSPYYCCMFTKAGVSHCLACSSANYSGYSLGEANLLSVEKGAPESDRWDQSGEKSDSFS